MPASSSCICGLDKEKQEKNKLKTKKKHFLATFETFYLLFLTLVSWGHLAPSLIFCWDCCSLTKTSLAVDVSKVWMNLPHLWHPERKVGRLLKLFQVCLFKEFLKSGLYVCINEKKMLIILNITALTVLHLLITTCLTCDWWNMC